MSRLLVTALAASALFTASASADRIDRPHHPHASAPVRFAQPPGTNTPAVAPARVLDRAAVRAKLAANRTANLARFRAYQKKGVFPSNTYAPGALNVWRDDAGNLCAAATIIHGSGQAGLVTRVAEQDNFIRLADVTEGPLMDWILTSGFTQAEIDAIQEPFMGVDGEWRREPVIVTQVDPARRKAEDARLRATYRQVDAALVRQHQASLDAATDLVMQRPALAWQLLPR
jgi:hypothetical protein